jgi:hypothetical protein
VTTLIVPANANLDPTFIDDWHRQGKKFVAAVWINQQAKTAEEHYQYWTSFLERGQFLDGIIIDEFIVNNPIVREREELGNSRDLENEIPVNSNREPERVLTRKRRIGARSPRTEALS